MSEIRVGQLYPNINSNLRDLKNIREEFHAKKRRYCFISNERV